MYIGIDLGTSSIKVVVIDDNDAVIDHEQTPLTLHHPQPLWSEQSPDEWWDALTVCMGALSKRQNLQQVKAIGITGQMHGATLLDGQHRLLRPAILWNDGRSSAQCQQLYEDVPYVQQMTGNVVMPGFTAPKLLWVQAYEPDIFARIATVLLPKDYLRFLLCGEFTTDMSDAAGTLWLNTATRDWDDGLLSACGLGRQHMPRLLEGNQVSGYLFPHLATRWGMASVPIFAGAGDNAAAAIGCGITSPGEAMLSLGTSGVYFMVTDSFVANPGRAVHSFCHALPHRWHLMSVMLSAASCVQWYAMQSGYPSVSALFDDISHNTSSHDAYVPIFLPYLTGERTPHNNPNAQAVFFGLTASTTRVQMALAVVQGVSMALAEGIGAVHSAAPMVDSITVVGGGSKSDYWCQLLADMTGICMLRREAGEVGPAFGAARLAQGKSEWSQPAVTARFQPNYQRYSLYQSRRETFSALYQSIQHLF